MKNRASLVRAFLCMVFFLAGCSSTPPVRFYNLHSLPSGQRENPATILGDNVAIGVGPVNFPEFLDRPQIVTRKSQNQVDIAEFHRWAGSFTGDFSRVLAKNLSTLLPTDRVAVYPWADSFSPTYQVKLDVEQFDGRLGKNVFLRVNWSVLDRQGQKELLVQKTLIEEKVSGNDYEALVAAKSNALATLSREIASEIRRLMHSG